ncbi:MAG: VWA domain-containing protein [Phycisphaerales bacterium]|nr:MAG: VWA domain-containing protein [Phycisphaerales bacterium]
MNFLNPTAIAIAAGLTIPPLVALYFLKLKRSVQLIPSTLLWKRTVEDLQVNSPFQRLRRSLLLLLQLLVLILAAIALGKPMLDMADPHESTIIILIDQSASMGVLEDDGQTRLDTAKQQAKLRIDDMDDDARAMVIAFCDRATVISSFDSDKSALKHKIDSIEQTHSTSSLGEAMSLAEAYAQTSIIGGSEAGRDIAPKSAAPPASVFIFTDGRIADASQVALQSFDLDEDRDTIQVTNIGRRDDNVGILAMQARRNYERPEILEVTATIRNFGLKAATFDAVLYVDGQNVDVQTVRLAPGGGNASEPTRTAAEPPDGSLTVVVFDHIEFEGGGIVEVVLHIDDSLSADNRAWTIIREPRHARVLLVTPGNLFLENALQSMPLELTTISAPEYERAEDKRILHGKRSAFDVVILDRHSTARLPRGNYFFWGAVPEIQGVTAGKTIDDQVIFNWDDTHPILRHVATETIFVYQWFQLSLPPETVPIIDGETTPVLAYFTRDASQFLISAFSLLAEDDAGNAMMNTFWPTSVDFVVFVQNSVQYLAGNVAVLGRRGISPGEPVSLPIPQDLTHTRVIRPDGVDDRVPVAGHPTIHYARTRIVGTYRVEPGEPGRNQFAVNLFDSTESQVAPTSTLTLGTQQIQAKTGTLNVNQPAWRHFVIAMLVLLLIEWIVYNRRVFV